MASILMFDDVTVDLLPSGYDAYAGYVDGIFANISAIRARFPGVNILTIAVRAADVADCLDIETGDATNADAPGWYKHSLSAGVTKPALYTEASNVDALVEVMTAAGIPRGSYRLWSAHYTNVSHLCGPNTCQACHVSADATQFTNHAEGKSLDESVCAAGFFTLVTPPAPTGLPVVTMGDHDSSPADTGGVIHKLQTRLNVWGAKLNVDGIFGLLTRTAVLDFQKARGLAQDGIVGPATWTALLKNPPLVKFAAPAGLRAELGIISVSWDVVPESQGKHPTGYTVKVLKGTEVVKTETVAGTTAVIDSLVRNDVYEIEVEANGGQAPPGSAKITVTA